jgi:hypothetical protein
MAVTQRRDLGRAIVALESNTHRSYGPNSGRTLATTAPSSTITPTNATASFGEIPLQIRFHGAPILEGNPTSFMAKIPAATPFTFQMLDKDGLVLTMAQTKIQVAPCQRAHNRGGRHAHSQRPDIASTPGPAAELRAGPHSVRSAVDEEFFKRNRRAHQRVVYAANVSSCIRPILAQLHRLPLLQQQPRVEQTWCSTTGYRDQ